MSLKTPIGAEKPWVRRALTWTQPVDIARGPITAPWTEWMESFLASVAGPFWGELSRVLPSETTADACSAVCLSLVRPPSFVVLARLCHTEGFIRLKHTSTTMNLRPLLG